MKTAQTIEPQAAKKEAEKTNADDETGIGRMEGSDLERCDAAH